MTPRNAVARKFSTLTEEELRLPAMEVRQGPTRRLYSFAIDGKQLHRIATVSRIRRDASSHLHGYQRPEAMAHISAIRRYIESEEPLMPNAVVVAFDDRVRFEPTPGLGTDSDITTFGTLIIPVDDIAPPAERPGWIVDGQQRCAAIRDAEVDSFPICVTAFITGSEGEHRSQFILVNNTKPLPKGLIHELLPEAEGTLPAQLQMRQLPALLVERLNYDGGDAEDKRPLFHMINTPTNPEGLIKDNSMLKMLESSLTDGALYRYRGTKDGSEDIEVMLATVNNFWSAVYDVFQDDWKPPRRSRLLHGIGIISLGSLMDAIAKRFPGDEPPSRDDFASHLKSVKDDCHWSEGSWDFGSNGGTREWNELQNTPRDIRRVNDYLLAVYNEKQGPVRRRSRAGNRAGLPEPRQEG